MLTINYKANMAHLHKGITIASAPSNSLETTRARGPSHTLEQRGGKEDEKQK
jgi:hypothetical protein